MSHEDQEYYLSQEGAGAGTGVELDATTAGGAAIVVHKTIVAKVRRASVLQSAQYRRTTTFESKTHSLSMS
jgi:hypothetical protein